MCSKTRWRMLEQHLHTRRNQGRYHIHLRGVFCILYFVLRLAAVLIYVPSKAAVCIRQRITYSMAGVKNGFRSNIGCVWLHSVLPLPHRLEAEATYTRCHAKSEAEKTRQRQIVQELSQKMNDSKRKSEALCTEVCSLLMVYS